MIRARVGRIGLRMPRSRSSASIACSDVRLWWGLDQEKRGALGAVLDTLWSTPVADIVMGVRHGKLITMRHPVLKKYLKQPAQLTVVSEDDGKWMIREVFEDECYAAFVDALPERGATVVDVGANIGAFALFCAQRRPSATVLCLEPVPSTAAALAANVAATSGNAGRVHVVQKGLTAPGQQGLMKFTCFEDVPSCSTARPQDKYAANIAPLYDASNFLNYYAKEKPRLCAFVRCLPAALQQPVLRAALAHAWRFSHRECELTTLSKCFESSGLPAPSTIDLLKVDVEGLELHVLEAIEPEWWPKVQSVAVEVHDLDGRLARVRALLCSLGFEVETKSDDIYNDKIGMNHHFVYAKRSSPSMDKGVSEAEPLLGALKDQYDSKEALTFYNEVMGGGGGNIHYGIFRSEEDGVREAADASVDFLAASINAHCPLRGARVLDVGSGTGAAAHVLLQQWNCASVLGFNLCPGQNATANELARELGVGERFGTVEGNFDEDFPPSLRGDTFDVIWSQEAFCHSKDKAALIARLADRLAPGGVLGFTDIMAGEDATAEQLRTFTDRNATSEMARCSDYIGYLRAAGLELATVSDMTRHLPRFFSLMAARIDASRSSLAAAGVSDEYMTNFRDSLRARVDFSQAGAFAWAFIVARKPGAPPEARSGLTGTLAGGGQGISTFAISGRASSHAVRAPQSRGITTAVGAAPASAAAPGPDVHVVGAGAVGTFLASMAARAGLRVDLQHSARGCADVVRSICARDGVRLVSALPPLGAGTLTFVATKTYDHREVLGGELATRHACVIHNGMARLTPPHYSAVAFGGWNFEPPDGLVARNLDQWALHPALAEHAALLERVGISATCDDAVFARRFLTKLLVNIAGSLLGVLHGSTCAQLVDEYSDEVDRLLNESMDVLRHDPALSFAWDRVLCTSALKGEVIESLHGYGDHKPSAVADFVSGKQLEIEALNGYVVDCGRELRMDTPFNRTLLDRLQAMSI